MTTRLTTPPLTQTMEPEMRALLLTSGLISASLLTAPALAQDGELRQLGAHVHGVAQLAVAADASGAVLAELSSPAYNLYGFERAPQNDAERQQIRDAATALASADLITFSSRAGCTLTDTQITGGPDDRPDAEGHEDHDHEHDSHGHDHDAHAHETHDHDDAHGHEDHEAHDHEHDHTDHEHEGHSHDDHSHGDHDHAEYAHGHSDVVVSWSFTCSTPASITEVNLAGLFEAFAAFETVQTQFFDGDRATASDLTARNTIIRIN